MRLPEFLPCMQWIAPSEKDTASATLEKQLRAAAEQLRANSGHKAQEYSAPVLGLIFLRFAEVRFLALRAKLQLPLRQIQNLRLTRDLLLPRLLSVKITLL
jgi:hypothetical protein